MVHTRLDHSLFNAHGVFSGPFCHFLVHFRDLGRIHGPKAPFPLASIRRWFLDLLEALVQAQVVPD